MKEVLEYLPEEHFEEKSNNLFYHPPDDTEEFQKHYELYWPVRMWVHESLEAVEADINSYSVLGVWAASSNTIKFTASDFEEAYFE